MSWRETRETKEYDTVWERLRNATSFLRTDFTITCQLSMTSSYGPLSSQLMSNILTPMWTRLSSQIILNQLNNLLTAAYISDYYKWEYSDN
jgi:hypothetical protein